MFTGIIAHVEEVRSIREEGTNKFFAIAKPADWHLSDGESIAINGVCSTVLQIEEEQFTVEYMPETLRETSMHDRIKGDLVNIERSMTPSDLLSGYIVSGHVEDVGVVTAIEQDGDSHLIDIQYSPQFAPLMIHKGGVTIDGIALTVIEPTKDRFRVAIIPHTYAHTTIQYWNPGDRVNLEYDTIAKYVQRFFALQQKN